jgi:hypothetical protein
METHEPQKMPAKGKSKQSWFSWSGIVLIVSGIALATVFFVNASREEGNRTSDQLLGISCLVQALVGVVLITHTRRTPPV